MTFKAVGRLDADGLMEKIHEAIVDGTPTAFLKVVTRNGERTARCYHHVDTHKSRLGCATPEWDDETYEFTGGILSGRSITSVDWDEENFEWANETNTINIPADKNVVGYLKDGE